MSEDLFNKSNVVTSNFFKATKVGDECKGVFVKKTVQFNQLKNGNQTLYFLLQDDGTEIVVAGKYGDPAVLAGLEAIPLGTEVGVRYDSDKESKVKGHQPMKVINVYRGEAKPEVLRKYINPMEEVQDDGLPPM